jgi:hypothetical protein
MYCTSCNNHNYTYLFEKKTGALYCLWQRFGDSVYKGTILEGWFVKDTKYYSPITMSIEDFQLPPPPPEEEENATTDYSSESESEDSIVYENTLITEITKQQEEEKITRLLTADEFITARLPRETNRETRCTFYVRMIYQLKGTKIQDTNSTYTLTKEFNDFIVNDYIQDNIFNNCEIISWLNQIWAYECDLSRSHLNTTLYKPIPYPMLHNGLVKERIENSPLISNDIDFSKKANFVLKYYGSEKPCVYNLCVMNKGKLEVYDTAHIPTLECQQYVVCLMRKMSRKDRVIVRCVYEKKIKKWIPIHYLKKPETKVISKKTLENLFN